MTSSRAWVLAVLAVLTSTMLASTMLASPATARSEGRIQGTITHGVELVPVPGVDVTLLRLDEGAPTPVGSATTDAGGRYAFDAVDTGVDHEVVATHDRAAYRAGPLRAVGDGAAVADLEVFASTSSPDDVVVSSWVLWVDHVDGVTLQHDLQVDNHGDRTWLGSDPDADGERAVVTVPLPSDATGLRFLGRFTQCCATMRGIDYVHTTALPPGRTTGTVRASVAALDRVELPVRLPVETFTMMVPSGTSVTADVLERSGEIDSRGNPYDVYTATELAPGDRLEIGLGGLAPERIPARRLAAVAALGVAAAAGLLWWWRRRAAVDGPTPWPARTGPGAGPTDPVHGPPSPAATASVPPDLLAEEIALLDVALERGLMPPAVHEPLRAARMAELERLVSPRER